MVDRAPKDYDCVIDYHLGKANVVADALSRKAAIELRAMFAQLSISDDGSLLAELRVNPVMFDQIRSSQLKDDKLLKKREMVQNCIAENFGVDDRSCLRFRNRICVPRYPELIQNHPETHFRRKLLMLLSQKALLCVEFYYSVSYWYYSVLTAIQEISTSAFLTSPDTSTVALAGGSFGKNVLYVSFMLA